MENLDERNIPPADFKNSRNQKTILNNKTKIFAVLIIIAIFGVIFYGTKVVKKEINDDELKTIIPQIIHSQKDSVPQGFPKEIPLNGKKDELSDSYTLNYDGSKNSQRVIDFDSSASVKKNLNFYKNWAGKNKWNILGEPYIESEARLILERDNKFLSIAIQKDDKETSKININYY